MTFIPIVPIVTPQQPPSPNARELGRRLKETIDGFRRENPSVNANDVRQALTLAADEGGAPRQTVLAVVLVGALAVGLLAFLVVGGSLSPIGTTMIFGVVIAVGVLALLLAVIAKNR